MRKYYIFNIRQDLFNTYSKEPYDLYIYLKSIKNSTEFLDIYKQICEPFDKNILERYFNNNKIIINNTYIKIKAKTNYPIIFKQLNKFSNTFLVCDFDNNDYFWLNKHINTNIMYCNLC